MRASIQRLNRSTMEEENSFQTVNSRQHDESWAAFPSNLPCSDTITKIEEERIGNNWVTIPSWAVPPLYTSLKE